jgi:DNA-binding NarL/FixJ family response regulator
MRSPALVSVPDVLASNGERPLLDAGRRNSFPEHRRRGGADVDASGGHVPRQIGVLLVDELWPARHRVSAPLNRQRSIRVLADTADSGAVVSLATRLRPDVCLVSRSIAPVMALTVVDRLKHLERPPRVLLYPDVADAEIAAAAICAGADGLISRAAEPAQIAAAIEAVAAGDRLFPTLQPSAARRVADLVGDGDRVIVSMLLLRARSDDIARTLGIGLRALHTRRRQILQKLDDALSTARLEHRRRKPTQLAILGEAERTAGPKP